MTSHDPALDAHINSNWGNAEQLLDFLSDRRLLSDSHVREDAAYCVESALQVRETMTVMMVASTPGPLKESLREIRAACRGFVSAAGPGGENFDQSHSLFAANLLALRLAIARQVQSIVTLFGMQPSREADELMRPIQESRRPGS